MALNNLATLDMSRHRPASAARGLSAALRLAPLHGTVQANLRVLLENLVARMYLVLVVGGLPLVIAVIADASWLVRAGLGTALLAACVAFVVSVARHTCLGG